MRPPTPRDPRGVWHTALVVIYAAAAVGWGLSCFCSTHSLTPSLAIAAVLAVAHGRSVAAYMVHECAHSSVFVHAEYNSLLGVIMLWLCGSPYVDFEHCKRIHMAHHKDRGDTVSFDYRAELRTLPQPCLSAILALEYCFVPIVEFLIHLRAGLAPLGLYPLAPKEATPLRIRLTALAGVCAVGALWAVLFRGGGVRALALHSVATALTHKFLSAHDAFQHTYEVIADADYATKYTHGPGERTAQYEESNTYSNLISTRAPLLNLLSLNFGYHNAHHSQPMVPWYKLPALHKKLYGARQYSHPQVLPFRELAATWLHNRVRRVLDEDYGHVAEGDAWSPGRANAFVGSLGVSFITA